MLNTLTEQHKLASIKYCSDTTGALKGIQFTAAILGSPNTDLINLTTFGDLTSPCQTATLKKGEYIKSFTFFYNFSRFMGATYKTSLDISKSMGKTDTTLSQFTFNFDQQFMLMGFFGSSNASLINSFGAIREKTDCLYFPKQENT